eukprot:TRINITY_DN17491_c0_g1_i1.p1 TRINITY_DN17491_c0_g1~~TRINITY_DN17491_c0_g1_i1.p1  ORF type:complete len:297 (+),score=59.46 TRINITY_DN17491_c0_g1_i1:69-893(+)
MTSVWKFGYGSNISKNNLETKKQLTILNYDIAVLKGYKLVFTSAIEYVEPAFATIEKGTEADEVHGSIFEIPNEQAVKLNQQEAVYNVETKEMKTYGGNTVNVEVYMPRSSGRKYAPPSQRYLRLLIGGGEEAGLKPSYVEKLRAIPHYVPSAETLARRDELPALETLKVYTADELKPMNGKEGRPTWTSIMGYIVQQKGDKWLFDSWKGRDVSHRNLLHFRGQSLDVNDVGGIFPCLADLTDEEVEYLRQNLDRYTQEDGVVQGALKDFVEAQ